MSGSESGSMCRVEGTFAEGRYGGVTKVSRMAIPGSLVLYRPTVVLSRLLMAMGMGLLKLNFLFSTILN
jgi:hypothetical protein